MFHDDMDFVIRIVLYIVVISVLYIVVMCIDDKLFKLMFDDNFHICMIYGIEIKSINQLLPINATDLSKTASEM
jgi:hypothetical protein